MKKARFSLFTLPKGKVHLSLHVSVKIDIFGYAKENSARGKSLPERFKKIRQRGTKSLLLRCDQCILIQFFLTNLPLPSPLHNINKPTSRRGCCFSLACHRRCLSLCEKRIIKDEAREAKYLVARSDTFGLSQSEKRAKRAKRAKRNLW